MAHLVFTIVLDMRRRSFRLSIFLAALAALALPSVHGALQNHADKMSMRLNEILNDRRICDSRQSARSKGVRLGEVYSRTLCPLRIDLDYDPLRVPENLTTVACGCEGKRCYPIGDYQCTTISHQFTVEYKNGTQRVLDLPIACACASSRVIVALHGMERRT